MTKETPSKTGSRRDFIKKSTILVAGSTVAGNLQIARAAHPYGDENNQDRTRRLWWSRYRSCCGKR